MGKKTPLHEAAERGDIRSVQLLLEGISGSLDDVNDRDSLQDNVCQDLFRERERERQREREKARDKEREEGRDLFFSMFLLISALWILLDE
jgi:hypothetical protein